MYTVYRQYDPNKTEMIAKPFRMGANEPYILKYLHSKPSPSPHIISLIETTPTISGRAWLILPKMHTLNSLLIDSRGVCGREQLSWGLIKGLAYLHEHNVAHRDIRPKNLVCDDDFRLKIIDFDIAMEVHDENTKAVSTTGPTGQRLKLTRETDRRFQCIALSRPTDGRVGKSFGIISWRRTETTASRSLLIS